MYWKITADHLWQEGDTLKSRKGLRIKGEVNGPLLKVRLLDDDREHYYSANSDDEALESLYHWAHRDAGVTILQVWDKDEGEWRDEIG